MKQITGLIVILALFSVMVTSVLASGFNIKSIGRSETGGRQITKWWYTSLNPTITGEAPADSDITVKVDDGAAETVRAGTDGVFSWTPVVPMTAGDHVMSFVNNGSEIKFTLTLGADLVSWDSVGSGSAETLPASGVAFPTIMLLISGGAGALGAWKILKS